MKPRLLIVDDMEHLRAELRGWLEETFEIVAEAEDGAQALQAWRAHRPDIIVMDVAMPNQNGIEATRAIVEEGRRTGESPSIVILSGIQDEAIVFQAFEAGAIDYLFKPANADIIRETLLGYLQKAV